MKRIRHVVTIAARVIAGASEQLLNHAPGAAADFSGRGPLGRQGAATDDPAGRVAHVDLRFCESLRPGRQRATS